MASAESTALRVLMVTPRYFPFMGGVETHVYEVARRLARGGVEVTVLTTDPGGRLPATEVSEGVRVERVRAWPAERDYYFAPGLFGAIARGDWDVVHCQGYHTLVPPLAMLAARRAKLPYVVTFHSGGHSSRLRNALRAYQWAALRPLLAGAERLVGVSRFEAEFFRQRLRLPSDRIVVIPNGSQLPEPSSRAADGGGALIVSIGRLERYKGHHRALAALPRVLERYPEARLRIAGSGPYEPELQRMAAELGVADRVEIRGVPPRDRHGMADLLAGAALVTLLSEYEAHPVAVMEAAALRRPVLVLGTSGLRELAEQGLARAIPASSSAEQVAAAMLDQLQRPPAPTTVRLPTWDECAGALLRTYHEVAGGVPCAC